MQEGKGQGCKLRARLHAEGEATQEPTEPATATSGAPTTRRTPPRTPRHHAGGGPEAAQPPKAPTDGTSSMGAAAAPQESPTPGKPQAESAEAAEASPDTARRCTQCTQDRPRHAYSSLQWAGKKSGNRERKCLRCAPKTAESGQRYCQQCDRAKPLADFGPDMGGKVKTVRKVCRSCSTQQSRLSFFVNGTPSE